MDLIDIDIKESTWLKILYESVALVHMRHDTHMDIHRSFSDHINFIVTH